MRWTKYQKSNKFDRLIAFRPKIWHIKRYKDKIRRQACGEQGYSEGRRKHSTTLEFKSPLD